MSQIENIALAKELSRTRELSCIYSEHYAKTQKSDIDLTEYLTHSIDILMNIL